MRVLLIIFFVLLLLTSISFAWTDQPHTPPDYMMIRAGEQYRIGNRASIGGAELQSTSGAVTSGEIWFAEPVPILSRLYIESSNDSDTTYNYNSKEKEKFGYFDGFAEVKTPFKISFLSHETPIYFQMGYRSERYSAKVTAPVQSYNGDLFDVGDYIGLGSLQRYFGIAVNTPITNEDSMDSFSRFGIYYIDNTQNRSAFEDGNILVLTNSKHGGVYYHIVKPVFAKGIIIDIYFRGGLGTQKVLDNSKGLKTGDFDHIDKLFFAEFRLGAKYKYDFTDYVSLGVGAQYAYSTAAGITGNNNDKISIGSNDASNAKGYLFLDIKI